MDAFEQHAQLAASLRNQLCELEIATPLRLPDGTVQEITHSRRSICRRVVRRQNRTLLDFVDVDWAALQREYPFNEYSAADFPEIFVDHVGWKVTEGIGPLRKVPLAWLTRTGGTWKYGAVRALGGAPVTVLAVYRGYQPGQGAVVDPSEYTLSTLTGASTGIWIHTINFTKEQLDESGRPYFLEADIIQPNLGSATGLSPAAEASRILAAYGILTYGASFGAAADLDNGDGFHVVPCYGYQERGRTGLAIIQDLLAAGRCWLSQKAGSDEWLLVQDSPKAPALTVDTRADLATVFEAGDGERVRTVSLEYRPKMSGQENYAGRLERSCGGASGEKRFSNPYISDHVVADKWLSYYAKRLSTLEEARGEIYAAQLGNGEVIEITDALVLGGTKQYIATGIRRPADRNDLQLRRYVADIYAYTPGQLPADATNGYTPDYSFTKPLAPTGLAVVSQGSSLATDGTLTSYALIRAVPPAVNWAQLRAVITDLTTNEQHPGQLYLSGANYDGVIPGLRPGRNYKVEAYAVNANGIDGIFSAPENFTAATPATVPSAPTITAQQLQPRSINVSWTKANPGAGATPVREYVVSRKVGAGAFAEYVTIDALAFVDENVNIGTAYQYKVYGRDKQNDGAESGLSASVTPQKIIGDSLITSQGVSGVSIADSSINRARSLTGTGSASGTVAAGGGFAIGLDTYTFFPSLGDSDHLRVGTKSGIPSPADQGVLTLYNDTGADKSFSLTWRKFNT